MPRDNMKACREQLASILDYYGVGGYELGLESELDTLLYRAFDVGTNS